MLAVVFHARMLCWPLPVAAAAAWLTTTPLACSMSAVRQLQQVFQGLLNSTPERYNADPTKLIRLWLHESDRTCECGGLAATSGGRGATAG